MNAHPNSYLNYTYQQRGTHNQMGDNQNIHQRITNIENQLNMLIRMMEYNNQMLRQMQSYNLNTVGSGGGSIIVRM